MYDIAIIGGEAIGLYMANKFAKKGYSVLSIERKNQTGNKPCSGLVSNHFLELIGDGEWVEKKYKAARIWIGEKSFDFKGNALTINRNLLNNYLKQKAIRNGVKFLWGENVIDVKEKSDFVEIIMEGGTFIKTRVLAGCDGIGSIVAKKNNFPPHKKMLLGVLCFQEKKDETQKRINVPELFFGKLFPGFFAWRIPGGRRIEWGMALLPKFNPKKRLKFFLNEKSIKTSEFSGALIPLYPLKTTTTKRCFLCGDSAGQIKPATGGGLIYGFYAAKIASQVINPRNPNLKIYEKTWREKLQKEIDLGYLFKRFYSLPDFLKKIGISWIQKKSNLDQDNPSTLFT